MDEITYEQARYRGKHWGQARGYYSFGGGHIFKGDWYKGKKRVIQGWANLYYRHQHAIETWRRDRGLENAIGEPRKPSLSPSTFLVNNEGDAYWNQAQQINKLDADGRFVHSHRIYDQKAYVVGIGWARSWRSQSSTRMHYSTYAARLEEFRAAIEEAAAAVNDEIIEWRLVYAHEAAYVAECYPDAIKV